MRTRSPVRRIVLVLLAMAHFSVPTLAAVAHAQLAQAETNDVARAHVEDLGQHRSTSAHPESCVFCQLLGRHMLSAADLMMHATGAVRAARPQVHSQEVHSRTSAARPSSRAPPAQS